MATTSMASAVLSCLMSPHVSPTKMCQTGIVSFMPAGAMSTRSNFETR